jgi:amino acid transporter
LKYLQVDTWPEFGGVLLGSLRGCKRVGEVFARKASGLVREASLLDTFGIGFMNNGVGVGIWTMASWGLYTMPTGNMFWASILATFMCITGIALVWGFLGGSMPRSGGDYIANSRIIHPAVGIAMSMTNAGFVMTMWIATLAPWMADPGMTTLLASVGAEQSWIDWCASAEGIFIIATLSNIWGFYIVVLGLKVYNINQRIVMFAGFFCLIVAGLVLSTSSHSDFVAAYNDAAAEAGQSMDYQATIDTVASEGVALAGSQPEFHWYDTLALFPGVAWATAYGYQITFICGEVKRPQRNIVLGQVLAALIPGFFLCWFAVGMVNVMGQDFLGSIAWIENNAEGPAYENYSLSGVNTFYLVSLLSDNSVVDALIGLVFILFDVLWMPISYIAFSRAAFAWGMDRLGPMWFTDVNAKYHSPVKNNILMFGMSEVGIAIYALNADTLLGIVIVALEAMSAWGVMALSGLLFPYVKRARTIWEASPYKFRLGPIYVLTLASIMNLLFVGILLYYFFSLENLEPFSRGGLVVYVVIWVFSVLWYLYWVRHWKKQGIDLSLAWKELPPA